MNRSPIMDCLLEGIENKAGVGSPADPPTHDIAGENIDYESHVDKAVPGGNVSKIRYPQPVRRGCMELSVDLVERTRRSLVADGCFDRFAADDALQAQIGHQSLNRATCNLEAFALHLPPYLARACRTTCRITPLRHAFMIGRWGDLQGPADRLDPILSTMIINKSSHLRNGRSSSAWAKYAEALRKISLACRSSRFSRSSAFSFAAISLGMPAR